MAKSSLSNRDQKRMVQMSNRLYPAKLRFLPNGSFQFDYRRGSTSTRLVLGNDLEQAYNRALVLRKELDNAIPVISSRDLSLLEWHEQWAESRKSKLAKTTQVAQRCYWEAVPETLKHESLSKINGKMVEKALAGIDAVVMRENVGAYLSTCLRGAVTEKLISQSPWVQSKKRKKRDVPVVSDDDLVRVIEAASESARPALALAAFCGLRLAEVMGLKVGDIDLEQHLVHVRENRIKLYGKEAEEVVKETKTNEPRVAYMKDAAIPFLLPVYLNRDPEEPIIRKYRRDYVRRLETACAAVGLRKLTFHDLRHCYATNLLSDGIGVEFVQGALGHKTSSTTLDIYGHLKPLQIQKQLQNTKMIPALLQSMKEWADTPPVDYNELLNDPGLNSHPVQTCQILSNAKENGVSPIKLTPRNPWWAMADSDCRLLPCEGSTLPLS